MTAPTGQRNTIYLFTGFGKEHPLYAPWCSELTRPVRELERLSPSEPVPPDAALIVTHRQYRYDDVGGLRRAMEAGVGVLVLADGILEYRNTWENPKLAEGSIFRPVFGHKLACIGRSQARLVEGWGNPGKCEVVGLPRLDAYPPQVPRVSSADAPFRLMILTAKTPGFTEQQLEITRASLRDLRDWLAHHPELGGRPIEVTWRVAGQLAEELSLPNDPFNSAANDLVERLGEIDAVITTPSTTALEAMLRGCPVAVLDYHNAPHYVPAVWTISHREQLDPVLRELMQPPVSKLDFQQAILLDSLECQTPAAPRLITLVEEMAETVCRCREEGRTLEFPARVLPLAGQPFGFPAAGTAASESNGFAQPTAALRVELEQAAVLYREQRAALDEYRASIQEGTQHRRLLETRLETAEARAARTTERAHAAELEMRRVQSRARQLEAQLERLQATLERRTDRLSKLRDLQATKQSQLQTKQERLDQLIHDFRELKTEWRGLRNKQLQLETELAQSKRQERAARAELEVLRRHWLLGPLRRLLQLAAPRASRDADNKTQQNSADA